MKAIRDTAVLPSRATLDSAGYDFRVDFDMMFTPGEHVFDTGICLEDGDLGHNEVMFLFPRSSLALKYRMRLVNTVGIIDADYRDPIKVCFSVDKTWCAKAGDRICQGVVLKYGLLPGEARPVDRRSGGFGSTGRRCSSA